MTRLDDKSILTHSVRVGALAFAAVAVLTLGACGDKKEKGATQVAAKVNGDEITVHQIDFALRQQRNLRPEQAEAAGRQLLERLIDQQLEVQNAEKLKLDRDPQTLQMIDAARREILARRYVESIVDKSAKPSDDEVKKYFSDHPALFSERKVYTLQITDVQAPAERRAEIVSHAESAKGAGEITDWLKAQDLKFTTNTKPAKAEELPLPMVDKVAALKEGQSIALQQQYGVSVLTVVAARGEPKTLEESQSAIEQFLSVDRRRNAVADVTKGLRKDAKIEYQGHFAASAPADGSAPASAPAVQPAPVPTAAPSAASANSGMDAATLQKGLK